MKPKSVEKPYRVPQRSVVLPKDRPDPLKVGPPYLSNDKEYFRLGFSIWASAAVLDMLVYNHYANHRRVMLRYFRAQMARLRYNIDQFLKTYQEVDKL